MLRRQSTLSAKLTATYGAMCAVVLLVLYLVLRMGISSYAEEVATVEMATNADAYQDTLRNARAQMQQSADLLARDFGFRRAAATEDEPTIVSALENLSERSGRGLALYIANNGRVMGTVPVPRADALALHQALSEQRKGSILSLDGQAYSFVAVTVTAPTDIGWVIFGTPVDDLLPSSAREEFERRHLSTRIVLIEQLPGPLQNAEAARQTIDAPWLHEANGIRMLRRVIFLDGILSNQSTHALVFDFSLEAATAAYRKLFTLIALVGSAGLLLLSVGCWLAARALTRPIAVLERAVNLVAKGGRQPVALTGTDEIGRLAQSFNRMVRSISAHEKEITHLALHDTLTGLPNRKALLDALGGYLSRGEPVAILALDLDDFKIINDSLGHPVGDKLLCAIANSLHTSMPEHMIARFGGDEFVVLICGEHIAERAAAAARILQRALTRPYTIEGHKMIVGASIGISIAPTDGDCADTLFKNADLALYSVKDAGRGSFRFFETSMNDAVQHRRELDRDMRNALANGEFVLYFQPLFHLEQNRITSLEALIRWHHPERGWIPPSEFIPLAEQNGMIEKIGQWVIQQALCRLKKWPSYLSVAVNVSPAQFRSPSLVPFIEQALREFAIHPSRLELEVTESLFIADLQETLAELGNLRALGVRIALDDFGTGFSSLSYLRKFPFDKLKIDRSFIEDLGTTDSAAKIFHAITDLAAAMGMETTAEGVEDEDQLALIRHQGCTYIQGYLFSRPLPAEQIDAMLRTVNGPTSTVSTSAAA